MRSNMKGIVAVAVAGLVALSVGVTGIAGAENPNAGAKLRDADGNTVGTVKLREKRGSVTVRAQVEGIEPGFHGFHLHQTGECEPPFTSAGGHFNPESTAHGDHAGDMPPLLVNEDGTAVLSFETARFTVADLFDEDGSAIIVHADPDNLANIPDRYHSHTEDVFGPDSATLATGDAGGRVACGVIGSPGRGRGGTG